MGNQIREWSENDRIENEEQLQDWVLQTEGLNLDHEDFFIEIELWFHRDPHRREEAENRIKEILELDGGKLLDIFVCEEINYHGLKASVKKELILKLKEKSNFTGMQLLKADSVMFINPSPQAMLRKQSPDSDLESSKTHKPKYEKSYAAILDGMPLQNHNDIKNFIDVLDLFDFEAKYPADKRFHGTAVSSIVINGTYKNDERINSKILHCPIMLSSGDREIIPNDKLFIKLVYDAVEMLFKEKESVRVINFSLGDLYRPYLARRISPLAKMIDFLSYKHKVLFLISAGNNAALSLDCDKEEFIRLSDEEKFSVVLSSKRKDLNNLKIISPAESVNSLCIGATEYDDSEIEKKITNQENGILYRNDKYCAAYSRVGLGVKKSIKPELLFPGGSSVYKKLFFSSKLESENPASNKFGLKHAFTAKSGDLNKQARGCGTSYATALATNNAIRIYEQLLENDYLSTEIFPDKEYDALLIKNLLLHSSWHDPDFLQFIHRKASANHSDGNFKKPRELARFHGYGKTDFERSISAFNHSVLFIACNKISAATQHDYEIPLPSEFRNQSLSSNIRLISTLVWFSDISPETSDYQQSKLDIQISKDGSFEEQISSEQAGNVMLNTCKHSIYELKKGKAILAIDSSNNLAKISVCSQKGNSKRNSDVIAYVLAITLEIDSDIDIYTEIHSHINSRTRTRT